MNNDYATTCANIENTGIDFCTYYIWLKTEWLTVKKWVTILFGWVNYAYSKNIWNFYIHRLHNSVVRNPSFTIKDAAAYLFNICAYCLVVDIQTLFNAFWSIPYQLKICLIYRQNIIFYIKTCFAVVVDVFLFLCKPINLLCLWITITCRRTYNENVRKKMKLDQILTGLSNHVRWVKIFLCGKERKDIWGNWVTELDYATMEKRWLV